MTEFDLSGLWRSRYVYHSGSRGQDFESRHTLRLEQSGGKITAESVPQDPSHVLLELAFDDSGEILTGTWREQTEKEGHYKGAVYSGAISMVVDASGNRISGKWVGAGSDKAVNTGLWELERMNSGA